MKRINVIMAVYNGEKYLQEQIESVLNNTFKNIRLFIYDDGSTDRTEDICNQYKEKNKGLVYYNKNNNNKGLVRNFLEGVKSIHVYGELNENDYFMFCDQDDVWLEYKLEKTLNHMKEVEHKYKANIPVGVFTDAYVVDEKLGIINESFFRSNGLNTNTLDLSHILMENRMIGCTVMFNYSLYNKLHTIPQNARFHDWWIALIASSFGRISFLNEATLLYRQHGGNIVGDKSFRSYVVKSMASLIKQKNTIYQSISQCEEFYGIYKNELKKEEQEIIHTFHQLMAYSWVKRRYVLIKNGYLKSGFIRNIGLLLII